MASHFSNVSARMSISFFLKEYLQSIDQFNAFELIENEELKKGLTDYYEHLNERNNSINIKLRVQSRVRLLFYTTYQLRYQFKSVEQFN